MNYTQKQSFVCVHIHVNIHMAFGYKVVFVRKCSDLTLILGRGFLSTEHPAMG